MAKISDTSQLSALTIERSKLGCSSITLSTHEGVCIASVAHAYLGCFFGRGVTDADAIEQAFALIREQLVAKFNALAS